MVVELTYCNETVPHISLIKESYMNDIYISIMNSIHFYKNLNHCFKRDECGIKFSSINYFLTKCVYLKQ